MMLSQAVEENVELPVELPVIWDVSTLMWRHSFELRFGIVIRIIQRYCSNTGAIMM